jgi:hemoglobin
VSVPPAPDPADREELRDPAQLDELVRRFYQAVLQDGLLGPIFEGMEPDWAVHLPRMVDFWSDRIFGTNEYRGNAVGAHQPVLDRFPFGDAELDRWLELWTETVDELFVGEAAERAVERAHLAATAIRTLARRHAGRQVRSLPLAP